MPKKIPVQFDTLPQTQSVENLLHAAIKALPLLQGIERQQIEVAIRQFETALVPTAWQTADFEGYLQGCDKDDVLAAMVVFQESYEISDMDWARIESACDQYLRAHAEEHA